MGENKVDLILYACGTSLCIVCKGFLELTQTVCGVMELRNNLVELFCGEIRKHSLEFAECVRGSGEDLGGLCFIQRACVLNEVIYAVSAAILVDIVRLAVQSGDDVQRFSHRISAVCKDLCAQMLGYKRDIRHDLLGIEDGVDALKNITVLCLHQICIVDMAVSVSFNALLKLKMTENFVQIFTHWLEEFEVFGINCEKGIAIFDKL